MLKGQPSVAAKSVTTDHRNPLEFKTALIFGGLFGFFAVITNLIVRHYGNWGVGFLSLVVGVTDIDPYILNLFQGDITKISLDTIVMATLVATASNNLMKLIYALSLGEPRIRKKIILGFGILIGVSIGFAIDLF